MHWDGRKPGVSGPIELRIFLPAPQSREVQRLFLLLFFYLVSEKMPKPEMPKVPTNRAHRTIQPRMPEHQCSPSWSRHGYQSRHKAIYGTSASRGLAENHSTVFHRATCLCSQDTTSVRLIRAYPQTACPPIIVASGAHLL